jgi:aspartate carbamoyltransferase regulatory subunit
MSKLIISNPHLNIGAIKDRVLLSHMSPNRKLEMYQYLCLASDKNAFNNVNLLSGLYDRFEISKINKFLSKLISLLSTV